MNLQSLVLCSDERIVRVLRRVLNDLEITMEHCSDPEVAGLKLSRRRFEAVIVDCQNPQMAGQILKAARNATSNKNAEAVALIDSQSDVVSALELGAHRSEERRVGKECRWRRRKERFEGRRRS